MARILARLHLVYGVVVALGSGFFLLKFLLDPGSAGACCGSSFAPLFIVLFGAVFVLALPQAGVALLFLRGAARGALWMVLLSVANGLINLTKITLVAAGGGGSLALWWVPLVLVNVLTLVVFARELARGGGASA